MRWEARNLHCLLLKPTVYDKLASSSSHYVRWFWLGSHADPDPGNAHINLKESRAALFFKNCLGPLLMEPVVKLIVILWYVIYLTFGIYGCSQIREGLEPVNLLVRDSYAIPHYRVLENYFWHYGATLQVNLDN